MRLQNLRYSDQINDYGSKPYLFSGFLKENKGYVCVAFFIALA